VRDSRNTPEDHPFSRYAHQIEESIVNLHYITTYLRDEVPKDELKHIHQIKRNLAVLHRREVARRA
jgi:hypothetical protein